MTTIDRLSALAYLIAFTSSFALFLIAIFGAKERRIERLVFTAVVAQYATINLIFIVT